MAQQTQTRRRGKKRGKVLQRVQSRKFAAMSAAFVREYPLCVWCVVNAKHNEGMHQYPKHDQRNLVVDHIQPHKGDMSLYWDTTNLQTLCRYPCHDKVKRCHDMSEKTYMGWFDKLREAMQENKSLPYVQQFRSLIPPHIQRELFKNLQGGAGQIAICLPP